MAGNTEREGLFAERQERGTELLRNDQGEVIGVVEIDNSGQYEKDCCGEAKENIWLDLLKFGATEVVYLDPYRSGLPERAPETGTTTVD